jgi:hypothetical protein
MSSATRFHDTLEKAHRNYGVRVISKDREYAKLWKVIDKFLKVITFGKQTRFLTHYTTTLGRTVYYPERWRIENVTDDDYEILCHEIKHVKQTHELFPECFPIAMVLFSLLYLFVPFPIGFAYFRYKFEREAYRISWYTALELGKKPDLDWYVEQLTGPSYFWTWIFKSQVKKWFKEHCRALQPSTGDTPTP